MQKELPKGIRIVPPIHEPVCKEAPQHLPWGYLMLQHMMVRKVESYLQEYNKNPENKSQPFFIHKSPRYKYKKADGKGGVKKDESMTVSGLVFLQGTTQQLQQFLKDNFQSIYLVNDCATKRPACIPDQVMQPFMLTMSQKPENVTFLRAPFEKFAKDHVKLRVLTGAFKGYEGYIVRIDRDRQLVFNFAGYAVALRGVHNEDFEVAEENWNKSVNE